MMEAFEGLLVIFNNGIGDFLELLFGPTLAMQIAFLSAPLVVAVLFPILLPIYLAQIL